LSIAMMARWGQIARKNEPPGALVNNTGDQPFECYNAAPTTQLALFHLEQNVLHADLVRWGWRPHWSKDRAAPINARVEKVAGILNAATKS
jgi:putative SOS response-associated peptidase YedK